jgi:hypothetical protein
MRHRNIWAGCLAMSLGLGMVGFALGQDPAESDGNWFTRLFYHGAPKGFRKREEKKEEERDLPVVAPKIARAQAQADFLRRLEVCDKLERIADDTGDMELKQKARQLHDRAWDAYVQRANHDGIATNTFDEETLQKNLAPKAGSPIPLARAGRGNVSEAQASTESRK